MGKKKMENMPIPRRNSYKKQKKKIYITPEKIMEENAKKADTLKENFLKLDSFNTSEIDINEINNNNNKTYTANGERFMTNEERNRNAKDKSTETVAEEKKKINSSAKTENKTAGKDAPLKKEAASPVTLNRSQNKNKPVFIKEISNRRKQKTSPSSTQKNTARGKSKTQNTAILILLLLILLLAVGAFVLLSGGKKNTSKNTLKEEQIAENELSALTKDFTIGKGSKMNFSNVLYSSENVNLPEDLKSFMAENINGTNFLKAMIYENEIDGNALKPNLPGRISAAKSFNENVKGWLRLKDSNVNIAVVHNAAKSNAYYTWLGYNEEYSKHSYGSARYLKDYGVAWAEQTSNIDGPRESLSNNTVIFGHNWENISSQPRRNDPSDIMFEQLAAYIYTDFAQENPYLNFATETENMMWVVVSAFYTEDYWFAYDKECANLGGIDPGGFNYIDSNFNEAQAEKFVKEIKARSEFNIEGVDITTSNKFLTLSTCTRAQGRSANQRFAVVAMLVDENNLPENLVYSTNESQKQPAV